MKIKKLLAIILALTFAFSCLSVIPVTVSAAEIETQTLQNTYHRLSVDKELTIGYIGGSVTAGTGATNAATDSWRALTTSWFKSQFPDATITEKNMAIGGHGTVFALYRMERALLELEGDLPDLIFIETAINDSYDSTEGDTLRRYMESIINKIYAKNPKCNIVMVITGNVSTMSTAHKTGVAFRQEHRDVAAHYGIPVIDAGAVLYNKIYAENGNSEVTSESNSVWKKYFQDSVHPINAGYKVYADTIKDYLASELVDKTLDASVYTDITMPAAPLMSNLLINAYDVDFSSFPFDTASHFTTKTYSPTNNAVSYKKLMSSNEGETFTVKFNGTSFGLWTWSYNTKTVISYSVDGGSKKTKEIYRSSSNHKAYTLVEGLKEGEHTITITHEDAAATFELYSMFITGNSATVTSAGYVGDNTATENVDNAIFIDKAVDKLPVNVFYPVSIMDADGVTLSGDVMLRLQFKCKMLSGTMPMIGWLRTDSTTNTSNTYAEQNWVDNESTDSDGDGLYTTYDAQAGIFTAYIKVSSWYKHGRDSDSGERYGYLTIGNMEHNGDWHHTYDYNASFIMSQPELKVYDPATGTVGTTNLIGDFRDAHVDFKGTYHQESQGTNQWNSPYFASANKWHIDSSPAYIKQVKVPSDFNTSENYSDANFVKTAETDYTREYYTNDNYSGLYFEKLDETNGGYAIVEDLNKKVIIIGANHEGEDDNRTTDGYKPTQNRKANIFIPISLWQYGGAVDDKVAASPDTQYIVKVTVKAKILEGSGYPVLGRVTANKKYNSGKGSEGLGKMARNMHLSGYYADGSHENYYDQNGNLLKYSYNPETEELVGYIRMKSGDSSYRSRWGQTEVLTIGNAENVWAAMTYDTTEFNSSFAISDVKVDVYKAQSHSGGGYEMVSLLAEDILPDFYAENIDTTSTWQYKFADSSKGSSSSTDLLRASQKLWQVDGATSLVSSYNLTECFDKHTLTHHEATDTTREYYACSCGKNYADKAATVEIDDITAKKQMLVINAAGEKIAQVAIPLDLRGFTGTKYFKFTTKLKTFGADAEPNVQVFLARREGQVGGATVDGDTKVVSTSYNKATGEFSAIIAIWHHQVRDSYCDYFYDEPNTGADCLITIGNMTHVGNGGKDNKYYSTFAIADPELYRITSETDETLVDGVNLMTNITDKTVVLNNNYAMLDWTSNYFSNENTPMSAPLNTWVRYGTGTSKIAVADIPAGFFEGTEADPNMLAIYGSGNQHAVTYETFLEPGETYLFDIDYKAYGGVKALINPQTAGTGSYATIEGATDDGSHYSVQFTMPSDARKSYAGNFKLYLGQKWPAKTSGSVYFANASLRKIGDAGPGENILLNGDFNYGNGEVITEGNYSEALPFWNKDDILNYAQAQTVAIPENFFAADAKETKDMALHFKGGNWNELQFFAQLEANTTYRLTYNYRAFGDMPTLIQRGGTGSVVINKISDVSNGEYLQTYEITTSADKSAGDIGNANTRFAFTFGAQSYDKEFYISNVKLYKVVNGETVGQNIVGDINPILDDTTADAIALGQDVATAMRRSVARGWLAGTQDKDKAGNQLTVSASVEKVADNFFTFIPYAERLVTIRKDLLGKEKIVDLLNYDADVDDAITLKDLVKIKKYSAGVVGEGGADVSAEIMYNKIMNAANTATQGTVYYVSNDGKDSNAGTSASAPLATITKANEKASSGDTILLNRGDVWRVVANSENSYVAESGVTYGAYGEGDKPLVLGSAKDYTTASWTNVSGNIWKTQISSDAHDGNRVGNIYFFANANDEEPTVIGRVVRNGQRFASYNDLIEEGDVYSDITDSWFGNDKGTVYVYCEGNPATKYDRIEIAEKREVFILQSGATFDNIAIKYAGGHALNGSGVSNVTVTNCEIGYVGGAPLNAEIYGNGIQFGLGGENITVKNNYVYQCLDAGITFQSWGVDGTTDTTEFKNITFADNLLTNNYYNIEFFTTGTSDYKQGANNAGNGKFTDIYITGNIMRFAGECWSATQRMDSADGTGNYRSANICVTNNAYYVNTSNLNIKNNIFDCTTSSHVYWTWYEVTADVDKTAHVGLNVEGNTFYQKAGATDGRVMYFGNTKSYSVASSQYGLDNAVALFDKNPAKVAWLDNIVF